MKVQAEVQQTWQTLSSRERRVLRAFAKGSLDAGLRCRCKIVLSLVQGNSPGTIAKGGQHSESQVYRVARRFIQDGLAGLADRREAIASGRAWRSLRLLVASTSGCKTNTKSFSVLSTSSFCKSTNLPSSADAASSNSSP